MSFAIYSELFNKLCYSQQPTSSKIFELFAKFEYSQNIGSAKQIHGHLGPTLIIDL